MTKHKLGSSLMHKKRHQSASPTSSRHKKSKTSQRQTDGDNEDEQGWTRVERRRSIKSPKKWQKLGNHAAANPPRFMYSNIEILKRESAVMIDDIREFILHLVADAPPPNWLRMNNVGAISKVIVLLIPGITPPLLSLPPIPTSAMSNPNLPIPIPLPSTTPAAGSDIGIPFLASTFSHACPTIAPGDPTRMHSVLNTFFHGPLSSHEKKKRAEQKDRSERALSKDPVQYTLSLEQMIENDYPIPSYMADIFQKPPGWVETPEERQESILSQHLGNTRTDIYAIDCEMCMTEDGKELARVCVIDYYSGVAVYDQLVKPLKPVLDYLTRWSGIIESDLQLVTTTLSEVQIHLLSLLSPSPTSPTAILLGHSLEFDLKALKLCHPRCIDTAVIFHHPRGRPLKPGLAWLTKKWCEREIQTRGDGGHDPEEDARACLDLLQKKVVQGPGYGEFKTDYESIFERMGRSTRRDGSGRIRSAVVDHGNPAVMHGAKATTTVPCKNDHEVLEGLLEAIPGHDFAFGRFMELASSLGWITPKASADDGPPVPTAPPPSVVSPEVAPITLAALNEQLCKLYTSLPARTALVIFTGHSDPRRMVFLNARKSAFENALKSGKTMEEIGRDMWWTTADGRDLEAEVEMAKRGLMFLGIKPQ